MPWYVICFLTGYMLKDTLQSPILFRSNENLSLIFPWVPLPILAYFHYAYDSFLIAERLNEILKPQTDLNTQRAAIVSALV